jgi:hypothetical protein
MNEAIGGTRGVWYFVCWVSETDVPDVVLLMRHYMYNHTKLHRLPAVFNLVDPLLPQLLDMYCKIVNTDKCGRVYTCLFFFSWRNSP